MGTAFKFVNLDESTNRTSGHKEVPEALRGWGEEGEGASREAEENLVESRILEVQ